jgi:hypothetical protein
MSPPPRTLVDLVPKVLNHLNALERPLGPVRARTSAARAGWVLLPHRDQRRAEVFNDVEWGLGHGEGVKAA